MIFVLGKVREMRISRLCFFSLRWKRRKIVHHILQRSEYCEGKYNNDNTLWRFGHSYIYSTSNHYISKSLFYNTITVTLL